MLTVAEGEITSHHVTDECVCVCFSPMACSKRAPVFVLFLHRSVRFFVHRNCEIRSIQAEQSSIVHLNNTLLISSIFILIFLNHLFLFVFFLYIFPSVYFLILCTQTPLSPLLNLSSFVSSRSDPGCGQLLPGGQLPELCQSDGAAAGRAFPGGWQTGLSNGQVPAGHYCGRLHRTGQ